MTETVETATTQPATYQIDHHAALPLRWDDAILVTVERGKLNSADFKKYMRSMKTSLKRSFPGNKIIVVPEGVSVRLLR